MATWRQPLRPSLPQSGWGSALMHSSRSRSGRNSLAVPVVTVERGRGRSAAAVAAVCRRSSGPLRPAPLSSAHLVAGPLAGTSVGGGGGSAAAVAGSSSVPARMASMSTGALIGGNITPTWRRSGPPSVVSSSVHSITGVPSTRTVRWSTPSHSARTVCGPL